MQVAPRLPLHRRPIATHFPDDERLWYRGLRFGEASELNPSWCASHATHTHALLRACMRRVQPVGACIATATTTSRMPRLPPHAIERMRNMPRLPCHAIERMRKTLHL